MLIYGKNGRADLLAIGQKSGMAWGLNPDTGRKPLYPRLSATKGSLQLQDNTTQLIFTNCML